MNLIYIHIGNEFPNYYYDSIKQSQKFYFGDIYSIVGNQAEELLSRNENNKKFNQISFLNKYGLGNFWSVTFQRLFVLEQIILENDFTDIVHIENDIMIYENPLNFLEQFKEVSNNEKILINPLINNHSTAAYIFIPNYKAIKNVNDRMVELLSLGESKLQELTNTTMINEMVLLNLVSKTTNYIDFLPSLPTDEHFDKFGICFDPASYGQYLGGTPNGFAPGFTDLRHYVGEKIFKNEVKPIFENHKPYFVYNDKEYKLANLHVHCKNLNKFA